MCVWRFNADSLALVLLLLLLDVVRLAMCDTLD